MEPCCAGLDPVEPLQGALLFATGLTVSLGHCIGMCGPIVAGFSVAQRDAGARPARLAGAIALYHSGRVLSYMGLGAVLAVVGAGLNLAAAQGAVSLVIGALMVVLAAGLLGWLPTRSWIERSPWARTVAQRIRVLLRTRHPAGQFGLGMTNGLLPCGPVAVIALGAATAGTIGAGALSMLFYGLGTVPALAVLGGSAGALSPTARRRLDRVSSFLILALSVQLVARGLAALGMVPHLEVGPVVFW